jgi:hypothetical protein
MSNSNKVWTSELVNEYNERYTLGYDVDVLGESPYFQKLYGWRAPELLYKYSESEEEEIIKCKEDILHFANKYAYAMTDNGVQKINLRPYQKKVLRAMQDNRMLIYLASRQVGKCFFFTSKIRIKHVDSQEIKEIYMYDLWYKLFKPKQFSILFYTKYLLYKLYAKIETYEK